jgi:hypothetical protein
MEDGNTDTKEGTREGENGKVRRRKGTQAKQKKNCRGNNYASARGKRDRLLFVIL